MPMQGNLMSAMLYIRPDLSHVVSMVSRYMHDPGKRHWKDLKWILWYIKDTADIGLVFENDTRGNQLYTRYIASNYAKDLDKHRSTTGYVLLLS